MSAPHGYNSVVRRVLEIPEILDIIFSFLDSASNTQNALVCKKWSDPSLSNVWRIVTNPHILFSLLAPTKEYRDRAQIIFVSLFTRVIDTAVKKRRYRNSNEEWRSRIGQDNPRLQRAESGTGPMWWCCAEKMATYLRMKQWANDRKCTRANSREG